MAKILVADDNSNIQKMVTLALKDQGIDVVAVGNGEAAIRKISEIRPQLVLADIFMPVRNGYEVCEFVKQSAEFAHIPVVLLVGAFDPLDEREAERVGADGVLKKPFVPPGPLITMVKSLLGSSLGDAAQPVAVPVEQPVTAPVAASVETARPPAAKPAESQSDEEFPEFFAVHPPAVEFGSGEKPVAFGAMLEGTVAEEESQREATSSRDSDFSTKRFWESPTSTEEDTEAEAPFWLDSEALLPGRDEADLLKPSSHTVEDRSSTVTDALLTGETSRGAPEEPLLHVDPSPLPDLTVNPNEWLESAMTNPPAPLPSDAGVPWSYAGPPETGTRSGGGNLVGPAVDGRAEARAVEQERRQRAEAQERAREPVDSAGWSTPLTPIQPSSAPEPPARSAGAVSYAAPQVPNPELVDAVVARVLERLQPHILDIVTREVFKPVVEALVRRELEKQ